MASAIAAGSLVAPIITLATGFVQTPFYKVGVCESAVAGPPPTNVVVAWEDGTRETFASAVGLIQLLPPVTPSLLGAYGTYADGTLPHPGGRLAGPVVAHVLAADASGVEQSEIVVIPSPQGFLAIPVSAFTVQAAA
jgi:hypothetical protein